MHDLEFEKLFPISPWNHLLQKGYTSAICILREQSYRSTLQILHTSGMIPGYAFMNGENWGYAVIRAMNELGSQNPDDPDVAKLASKYFDEFDAIFDNSSTIHFMEAVGNAIKIATLPGRPLSHGALHGLLKAMVILSYSAFEVLCDDIWHDVTSTRPHMVAHLTQRQKDFIGFGSRKRIRHSFDLPFAPDNHAICAALAPKSIDALALVRNVLIHSAGKLDDDFIQGAQNVPEMASLLIEGKGFEVKFTGRWVNGLISPVKDSAYELLRAVDDWIVAHP